MTFNEYQKEAYTAIQKHSDKKDEVLNWAIGLAEENGEVFNLIKHEYWAGEEASKEELAKEIGDVLWYLSALCTSFGLSLEVIAQLNLGKLKHRHRGGEFSSEGSLHRRELELGYKDTEEYKNLLAALNISSEV